MSAYVQMKRVLGGREGELRLWARVVAGASANVLTWAVLFPLDTIRRLGLGSGLGLGLGLALR